MFSHITDHTCALLFVVMDTKEAAVTRHLLHMYAVFQQRGPY